MAKPLNTRITNALSTDRIGIPDLRQLIADVTEERDRQVELYKSASAESMNFNFDEAAQDEAAAKAERAGRAAKALTTALATLDDKLVARLADENTKAKQAQREEAIAERDALASRIKSEWPVLSAGMVEILKAIVANDERMRALGINEPSAEAVARDIPGNFYLNSIPLSQFTRMKIPGWNGTETAWPIPKPPFDMRAAVQKQVEINAADEAAKAHLYQWHRATVTNGVGNRYKGKMRDGKIDLGQISNGETEIQITVQEAERLNAIRGITVTKLDKAPDAPASYFKHPAAA